MSWKVFGDWGTSKLRLFRMVDGVAIERREGPGIANLREPIESVLRSTLTVWRGSEPPVSIELCGMVGSRNGWVEAPYVDCPSDAMTWRARAAHLTLDAIPVVIGAGLACVDQDGAPDVMRGEETQLFGAVVIDPALGNGAHVVALPGTHSKWATIVDGRITGFRTFLTGEMFALLRDHSTLTRAGPEGESEDDAHGFQEGLARAATSDRMLGAIFEARSGQLRMNRSLSWARGFLSGMLIGREIKEALGEADIGGALTLIGDPKLVDRYSSACAALGVAVRRLDGDACVLAGLSVLEAA